jgi:hypothetical protein
MSNVYSFLNVQCAINGPGGSINLGAGAATSDEGITISPSNPINTMQIGADGNGQHSLHADRSGKITVRLLKTSPVNRLLSAMYNAQTASAANHGQNVISLTDTQRGDSITASGVAFEKAPDLTYGKEAGLVDWEFAAIAISRTLGQ